VLVLSFVMIIVGCTRSREQPPSDTAVLSTQRSPSESKGTNFQFTDVTVLSQIDSRYNNGEAGGHKSIVESLGGGIGLLDFDRDGRLDIVLPAGGVLELDQPLTGHPTTLWRNLGDWAFTPCAIPAGVSESRVYTHGVAAGDVNQDGFIDFIITGYGPLQLFMNQGDGTFERRDTAMGLKDNQWSTSAAFADFNNDGILDLYVARYVDWSWQNHPRCSAAIAGQTDVCAPSDFKPLADGLYYGSESGIFREALQNVNLLPEGKGLGVVACDLTHNSYTDIYVANDTTNNFLYINQGDGYLKESGLIAGVAVDGSGTANGSMGLAVLDFNADLKPDLWVSNYESEAFALYQNAGQGNFLFATNRAGINRLGDLFVGFGTVAADLDLDGDEDLVVSNGHVIHYPRQGTVAQQPLLLENMTRDASSRPGQFERVVFDSSTYFGNSHRGRGVVFGDLDGDGDLDLVFSHINGPPAVLRNDTATDSKLLSVNLVGTTSNRDAIGSRVVMKTNRGTTLRQVVGGGSYLSQNPYTVFFAIGPGEQIQSLEITWPGGRQQVVHDIPTPRDKSNGGKLTVVESHSASAADTHD